MKCNLAKPILKSVVGISWNQWLRTFFSTFGFPLMWFIFVMMFVFLMSMSRFLYSNLTNFMQKKSNPNIHIFPLEIYTINVWIVYVAYVKMSLFVYRGKQNSSHCVSNWEPSLFFFSYVFILLRWFFYQYNFFLWFLFYLWDLRALIHCSFAWIAITQMRTYITY